MDEMLPDGNLILMSEQPIDARQESEQNRTDAEREHLNEHVNSILEYRSVEFLAG